MVIKLSDLIKLYKLNIKGVLHIGAHYGEEYDTYKENGINKMMFFEPLPDNYQHLLDTIRKDFPSIEGYPQDLEVADKQRKLQVKALNIALGNSSGVLPMYVETANQSQSSSLLKPKKHLEQYPHITFNQRIDVNLDKLDNLQVDRVYNMINIDVQGFELEVFKGGKATLAKQIDYIYAEVNRAELYENCPMIEELDTFLGELGFIRVITDWLGETWGDALYIKRHLAPSSMVQKLIRFRFSKRGRSLLKMFRKGENRGSKRIFKLIKKFIAPKVGKLKYQVLFESLYQLSLKGMNFGGCGTDDSGERQAIQNMKNRLASQGKLTVFDVGANIGNYTLLFHEVLGDRAEIHAFEPSKKTYQSLSRNVGGIAGVLLYNHGFGNENAMLTLYSDHDDSGIASVYNRNLQHLNLQLSNTEEIEIKTVDSFCASNDIKHLHYLKIDVEGHELKVLEGAAQMLAADAIDYIQFEFGGTQIDSRTFFRDFFYLLKEKYVIHRIVKDGIVAINEYSEALEVFSLVNYLAIRKNLASVRHK